MASRCDVARMIDRVIRPRLAAMRSDSSPSKPPPCESNSFEVAFERLRHDLEKPPLGARSDRHVEQLPFALLWPVALDWYRHVACLGDAYPSDGDVLARGTRLMFLRTSDPEYGDFWRLLDGPLEGTYAVFRRSRSRVPGEWGVVALDEPLLRQPEAARQLYEALATLLPPML